ncbi:MAG: hypothetical protein WAQ05_26065, partial [Rubrivivax sp.]
MQDHPVLSQLRLGYSPMIDRQRAVIATRLTIFPERPDASIDAPALLAALAEVWPAPADTAPKLSLNLRPLDPAAVKARAAAAAIPPVALNVAGETALNAMMAARPGPGLMVEVPAFMVADPAHHAALLALHGAGSTMLIKGRPLSALPRDLLPCFAHSIVDIDEERRNGPPAEAMPRDISTVQS